MADRPLDEQLEDVGSKLLVVIESTLSRWLSSLDAWLSQRD